MKDVFIVLNRSAKAHVVTSSLRPKHICSLWLLLDTTTPWKNKYVTQKSKDDGWPCKIIINYWIFFFFSFFHREPLLRPCHESTPKLAEIQEQRWWMWSVFVKFFKKKENYSGPGFKVAAQTSFSRCATVNNLPGYLVVKRLESNIIHLFLKGSTLSCC